MGSTIGEENKKVLQTDGGVRKGGGAKNASTFAAVVRRSAIAQRDVRSSRLPERGPTPSRNLPRLHGDQGAEEPLLTHDSSHL